MLLGTVTLRNTSLSVGSNTSLRLLGAMSVADSATVYLGVGSALESRATGTAFATFDNYGTIVGGEGAAIGIGESTVGSKGYVRNGAGGLIDAYGLVVVANSDEDSASGLVGQNRGTMKARPGATLNLIGAASIGSGAIDNAGGTLRADAGGVVNIYTRVRGGTISVAPNSGSPLFEFGTVNLYNRLDGRASSVSLPEAGGTLTVGGGAAFAGTFNNAGTVNIPSGITLSLFGDTTLGGGGLVTMTGGLFPSTIDANGRTLTLAGQTLRGSGVLGTPATGIILNLDNTSLIDANDSGNPLVVNSVGTSTNAGLLRTTGTAVLTVQGSGLLDNSGGVVLPLGTGSVINLNTDTFGGTIYSQGTLSQLPDGSTVPVNGRVVFRGQLGGGLLADPPVVLRGLVSSTESSTLWGTIDNRGTLETAGTLGGSATLTGGGLTTFTNAVPGAASGIITLTLNSGVISNSPALGTAGTNLRLVVETAGTIDTNRAMSIRTAGASVNRGVISTVANGDLTLTAASGTFANAGVLSAGLSSTSKITWGGIAGSLSNSGTVLAADGGQLTITSNLNNTGLLRAEGGGVLNAQGLANLDGGTLTGGRYEVVGATSKLQLPGSITTNAATLLIDGANGLSFFGPTYGLLNQSGGYALGGLTTNTAAGSITIRNTAATSTTHQLGNAFLGSAVANAGAVRIQGNTLAYVGSFTQTAGTLDIADPDSRLTAFGPVSISGGTVTGKGTVTASGVTVGAATLSPGASPGLLNISSDLTLSNTSLLNIELGGTTPGTGHDVLAVTGAATLNNATLNVRFYNGFQNTIQPTDSFTFLTATGGVSGTFAGLPDGSRIATADGHGTLQVHYTANSVVLTDFTPVPEPGCMLAAAAGGLAVAAWCRRRKFWRQHAAAA